MEKCRFALWDQRRVKTLRHQNRAKRPAFMESHRITDSSHGVALLRAGSRVFVSNDRPVLCFFNTLLFIQLCLVLSPFVHCDLTVTHLAFIKQAPPRRSSLRTRTPRRRPSRLAPRACRPLRALWESNLRRETNSLPNGKEPLLGLLFGMKSTIFCDALNLSALTKDSTADAIRTRKRITSWRTLSWRRAKH